MTQRFDGFGLSESERESLLSMEHWEITAFILKQALKSPDIMGEALRDYCFIGEGLGCYETFELREGFTPIEKDSRTGQTLLHAIAYQEEEKDAQSVHLYYDLTTNIFIAWYWDGDGTLLIGYDNKWVINTDCKRRMDWEFTNPLTR